LSQNIPFLSQGSVCEKKAA